MSPSGAISLGGWGSWRSCSRVSMSSRRQGELGLSQKRILRIRIFFFMFIYWRGGMYRSENNFQESILSFHHECCEDKTQVIRLGSKWVYPLSTLSCPGRLYVKECTGQLRTCERWEMKRYMASPSNLRGHSHREDSTHFRCVTSAGCGCHCYSLISDGTNSHTRGHTKALHKHHLVESFQWPMW